MLVFDSATLPTRERYGAIHDAITSAASATFMAPARGGESVHLRMQAWDLGGGVEVIDARCSAHTLRRTVRAGDEQPTYLITCGLKGRGAHHQLDREMPVRPTGVWGTDLTHPYVHHVTDTWTTTAKVPRDLLGVPSRLAGPAFQHLSDSPLAPLFHRHMAEVRDVAGDLNPVAAASLGTATIALTRALIASVTDDDRLNRETTGDILLLQVKEFVRAHLADRALDPRTVAAANHVSLRHLYKTCAQADLHLEQWIIAERLAGAHEELARPSSAPVSIAAVARRWGFSSTSHFARRFREAYELSPSEWQALNRRR
ncbi:AraC family transcriptional regulator [Cellulomonas rhizosphaerae]|uniref:AraC family transcriptional regulator n=1 Tax=Cellulomonas rhizosphaerae TaxID=2293719 RepID=UPI0013141178|nr:helix-turn-helix domain-containing protein [Cellulomonas rhizosphaerae]